MIISMQVKSKRVQGCTFIYCHLLGGESVKTEYALRLVKGRHRLHPSSHRSVSPHDGDASPLSSPYPGGPGLLTGAAHGGEYAHHLVHL